MKQNLLNLVTPEMRLSMAFSSTSQQPLNHLVVSLRMSETLLQDTVPPSPAFHWYRIIDSHIYEFGSRTFRACVRFFDFLVVCATVSFAFLDLTLTVSSLHLSRSFVHHHSHSVIFSFAYQFSGLQHLSAERDQAQLIAIFSTSPFPEFHYAFHDNHTTGSLL